MFDAHSLRSPLDPLNLLTPSRRPVSKPESVTVLDGLVLCDHGHSTPWPTRCQRNWFRSAGEMLEFFECVHGLPFEGLLIRW